MGGMRKLGSRVSIGVAPPNQAIQSEIIVAMGRALKNLRKLKSEYADLDLANTKKWHRLTDEFN
ncbi:hypothetical protein M407DRAFT_18207 [Tulasnella calospora MUT 4182]|uniref:Uncharacterized protein n=1 Tax=Tulasnella calospora MUT 4182 TaxID=1051891 RepID=A0A0C3QK10_9AGAM|nr:hypothetical protein M407DRAFT_18207 [Tulasnella calospora MUT 4182]